jgi:uncharacterized 2Fe-2S/4Fe-4S cluster protein (DUF4445 family)
LLQDALFAQGVEFPCGGRGRCKGCRIKLLGGSLPLTAEEKRLFTRAKLADGWRLACRGQANGDLKIEVAQWELAILVDDSVFAFTPQEGLGVAVDLGTTTVVAQLLDLRTGHVLAVRMALNAQAKHGADIMSRVEFAAHSGGQAVLKKLIREQLGRLIAGLLTATNVNACELKNIVIVGNTVMHHLFCGLSAEPLSRHPFEPAQDGLQIFQADALGWKHPGKPTVRFLPCLGSFVGSDRRIGLLDFPPEKVLPAGNTALLGAKIALFNLPSEAGAYDPIRWRTRHVPLNEDLQFMDIYVDEMAFPAGAPSLAAPGVLDQPA